MTQPTSDRFFEVKIELFDGPIDLLLHLVKLRELPIERVSLSAVTGQYLECIKSLNYYDIEVAAEYLVIAATLLSIKASVLLNDPVDAITMPDVDLGPGIDEAELLRRLEELARIRVVAKQLSETSMLGIDVFAREQKGQVIDSSQVPLANHESSLLSKAFTQVLTRLSEKGVPFKIEFDPVSVVERMTRVIDTISQRGGRATFEQLIGAETSKISMVGIFVALLELARRHVIAVDQQGPHQEISISLRSSEGATEHNAGSSAEAA